MPHQVPCVYVLRSEKNGRYFVGSTVDLLDQLFKHKAGKVKATKALLPVEICLSQVYPSLAEAKIVERELKKIEHTPLLKQIVAEGIIHSLSETEPA